MYTQYELLAAPNQSLKRPTVEDEDYYDEECDDYTEVNVAGGLDDITDGQLEDSLLEKRSLPPPDCVENPPECVTKAPDCATKHAPCVGLPVRFPLRMADMELHPDFEVGYLFDKGREDLIGFFSPKAPMVTENPTVTEYPIATVTVSVTVSVAKPCKKCNRLPSGDRNRPSPTTGTETTNTVSTHPALCMCGTDCDTITADCLKTVPYESGWHASYVTTTKTVPIWSRATNPSTVTTMLQSTVLSDGVDVTTVQWEETETIGVPYVTDNVSVKQVSSTIKETLTSKQNWRLKETRTTTQTYWVPVTPTTTNSVRTINEFPGIYEIGEPPAHPNGCTCEGPAHGIGRGKVGDRFEQRDDLGKMRIWEITAINGPRICCNEVTDEHWPGRK